MSVAANIGITPKLKGDASTDIAAKVDELLDLVRLDRANFATAFRMNSPAASASASASPARSLRSRRSY